jgi:histidinol phosphatase-like enzyme (inositol monophosphatase family)
MDPIPKKGRLANRTILGTEAHIHLGIKMHSEPFDVAEVLSFSILLAREAGEITLQYFHRKLNVRRKADGSCVTAADVEVERYLRARILEKYPNDGIIGEETGEQTGCTGRQWIIDPIDGTYSFARGVPLYGVLIGVLIDGEPTIGVANTPAAGELVYARRGHGCFCNGKRSRTTSTAFVRDSLLLATDFGAFSKYGLSEGVERLQHLAACRRTWGDCYGHLLVATGRADIMIDHIMSVWDCAALLPIIEEAGGTFTDWYGRRTIHGMQAISTNGALLTEVQEILNQGTDSQRMSFKPIESNR